MFSPWIMFKLWSFLFVIHCGMIWYTNTRVRGITTEQTPGLKYVLVGTNVDLE